MKNRIVVGIVIAIVFFAYSCRKKSISNDERFRPRVHFSLLENWTGEPSGVIYYEGEYHLFFQYNPKQAVFGNINWGHAISTDLIHWEQLPVAISPESSTAQVLSGSVVADIQNTSGLGSKANPALITFYTIHDPAKADNNKKSNNTIELSYSLDRGRTWTKQNKPVLKNSDAPVFRNPKVSWNKLSNQWLMTVSVGSAIQIYSSTDCIQWSYLSEFGSAIHTEGGWESSDLFPMKVSGGEMTKWVLLVSMNGGPSGRFTGNPVFRGRF